MGELTVDIMVVVTVAVAQAGTLEEAADSVDDELDKMLLDEELETEEEVTALLEDNEDDVEELDRRLLEDEELMIDEEVPTVLEGITDVVDELDNSLELEVPLVAEVIEEDDDCKLEVVTGVLVAETTLLELELDTEEVLVGPITTPVHPQTIFRETGRGVA